MLAVHESVIFGLGVIGVREGLSEHGLDMGVRGRVEDKGALAAPPHQTCQAQLGHVLTNGVRADADHLRKAGDRRLSLVQRGEQLDPGWVGEHPESLGGQVGVLIAGHSQLGQVIVHTDSIFCRVQRIMHLALAGDSLAEDYVLLDGGYAGERLWITEPEALTVTERVDIINDVLGLEVEAVTALSESDI